MLNDNETVLTFYCSTTTVFLGCTVEVLVNSRTFDDIKSINNTCCHKDGICQPDRCACSVECKKFAWNTTVQSDSINNTFGCGSRLFDNGNTYKAKTSLKWNGDSKLIIFQKKTQRERELKRSKTKIGKHCSAFLRLLKIYRQVRFRPDLWTSLL